MCKVRLRRRNCLFLSLGKACIDWPSGAFSPLLPSSRYNLSTLHHPSLQEPRWRPADRFTAARLPCHSRSWLLDDGSLTSRLVNSGQGRFTVERLHQSWEFVRSDEARLLGIPRRQLALVREVVLRLDARPVVFARSVFPLASLAGELGHLRHLQNKSLGAILFSHPGMRRTPFELAEIAGASSYLPGALHQDISAWGRRSCFELLGKRLMVSEVFLQEFRPWTALLPVHRSQRGRVMTAIRQPRQ